MKKILYLFIMFLVLGMAANAFAWNEKCTNGSGEATKGNLKVFIANCDNSFKNATVVGVGGLPFNISSGTKQAISLTRELKRDNVLSISNEQSIAFPALDLDINGAQMSYKTAQNNSISNSQGISQNMEQTSGSNMQFDTAFVFFIERAWFNKISLYKTYAIIDLLYFHLYLHQKYSVIDNLISIFLLQTSNIIEHINYNNATSLNSKNENALIASYLIKNTHETKRQVLSNMAINTINGAERFVYHPQILILKKIASENSSKLKKEKMDKKYALARAKVFSIVFKIIFAILVIAIIGGLAFFLFKNKIKITINK